MLRDAFIQDQIFSLTLMATAQRGALYRANTREIDRTKVQDELRQGLERLAPNYERHQPSEERHIENIRLLANQITTQCASTLLGSKFRIGSAQKALNLYIKYRWCLDKTHAIPPHCPVDGVVLAKVEGVSDLRWTRMDNVADYQRAIDAIRGSANNAGMSIAEWELKVWNDYRQRRATSS